MISGIVVRIFILYCFVYHVESYPFHGSRAPSRIDSDVSRQLSRPVPDTRVKTVTRPIQMRAGIASEIPRQRAAQGNGNTIPAVRTALPGVNFNVAFDRSGGSSVVQSRREWQSRVDETGNRRGLENQFINSVWRPHNWNTDAVWDNGEQFSGLGTGTPRRQLVRGNNLDAIDESLNTWSDIDLTNDIRGNQLNPPPRVNGFIRANLGQTTGRDSRFALGLDTSLSENGNINNRLDPQGRRRDRVRFGLPRRTLRPPGTLVTTRDQTPLDNGIFNQVQVPITGEIPPSFPNQNFVSPDLGRDRVRVRVDGQQNTPLGVERRLVASIPTATSDVSDTGEKPVFSVGQEKERTLSSADSSSFQYSFGY